VAGDPFVLSAFVAAGTERITIATGIANIYARDAMATKAAAKTLAVAAPGRFVLGLGVSSPRLVSGVRGHEYGKPVPAMRAYLDAMEKALYRGPEPERDAPIVLAALGPVMLALARDRTAGAFPYLVTPEHTRGARAILGNDRWLCVEQMIVDERDPARARDVGRRAVASYLTAPGYRDNLARLGFTLDDIESKSDRLVDALVAWGGDDAIRRRVDEHFAAGADHVCVQALRFEGVGPDVALLERLAPGAARASS
jgi:probable F420-dependent oxidoreductase